MVTNQPYFYRKAELFPDSTFVVGVDTALRLLDVSYFLNYLMYSANFTVPLSVIKLFLAYAQNW